MAGYNWRTPEISAALGTLQLSSTTIIADEDEFECMKRHLA
jgi:dTDP-4-amino-4,6-dideoxygalactose transaminase